MDDFPTSMDDFQRDMVDGLLHPPISTNYVHVVQSPCGSGKSHIAAALIRRYQDQNKRICLVTPNRVITEQFLNLLKGVSCDIYSADNEYKDKESGNLCIYTKYDLTWSKTVPKSRVKQRLKDSFDL